jgi:hypothetical protein
MNRNNTQITESNWLEWLVKRISVRTMDANRLYASEILAILLQSSDGRLVASRMIVGFCVEWPSWLFWHCCATAHSEFAVGIEPFRHAENRKRLGAMGGIDNLLRAIAVCSFSIETRGGLQQAVGCVPIAK